MLKIGKSGNNGKRVENIILGQRLHMGSLDGRRI
jgi:hypothetical protein